MGKQGLFKGKTTVNHSSRRLVYNRIGATCLPAPLWISNAYPTGLRRLRAQLVKVPHDSAVRNLSIEVFNALRRVEGRRYAIWFAVDGTERREAIERYFGGPSLKAAALKIREDYMAETAAMFEADRACRSGAGIDTLLRHSTQFRREIVSHLDSLRIGEVDMPPELGPWTRIEVLDDDGTFSTTPFEHLNIVSEIWSAAEKNGLSDEALAFGIPADQRALWIERMYLAAAVAHLDAASLPKVRGTDSATRYALDAADALRLSKTCLQRPQYEQSPEDVRSESAKRAAQLRHALSPKAEEKRRIRDRWDAWQEGRESHKSKAAFARVMIHGAKHLQSTAVIEGWCRLWEDERCENT